MQINLRGGRAVEENINYICMGFEVCACACVWTGDQVCEEKKGELLFLFSTYVHYQLKVCTHYPMLNVLFMQGDYFEE